MCFFCKKKGHRQFDCPLKATNKAPVPMKMAIVALAVSNPDEEEAEVAVLVVKKNKVLKLSGPLVEISCVRQKVYGLPAIIDTSSPV